VEERIGRGVDDQASDILSINKLRRKTRKERVPIFYDGGREIGSTMAKKTLHQIEVEPGKATVYLQLGERGEGKSDGKGRVF